jgi:hypothetical protein
VAQAGSVARESAHHYRHAHITLHKFSFLFIFHPNDKNTKINNTIIDIQDYEDNDDADSYSESDSAMLAT